MNQLNLPLQAFHVFSPIAIFVSVALFPSNHSIGYSTFFLNSLITALIPMANPRKARLPAFYSICLFYFKIERKHTYKFIIALFWISCNLSFTFPKYPLFCLHSSPITPWIIENFYTTFLLKPFIIPLLPLPLTHTHSTHHTPPVKPSHSSHWPKKLKPLI